MSSFLIDGKAFAESLVSTVGNAVVSLIKDQNFKPGLAVVLVGDNPASEVYVRNKVKQTEKAGMVSIEHRLPDTTSESELIELVNSLNNDEDIDGILVQLPLPNHIDENSIINAISPSKDVDGFSIPNVGLLSTSGDGLIPCTPLGCLLLLKDYLGDLTGKTAVIVGRSNIVGKPMAQLLIKENCTVTIAHSKTIGLPDVCKDADILVAAVGKPEFVKAEWIKKGAVVIDVGINRLPAVGDKKSKLVGDVDFESVSKVCSAITPVPGGVGPMTIACLLRNTVTAACKRRKVIEPVM
jgi:methylenetetrahydrofolate dehydrogenase (NADP+)/methenyltetrahydrofolate cyclohydrolase